MYKLICLLAGLLAVSLAFSGPAQAQQRSNPVVKLETSMGDIYIELYPDKAPKSVENFLAYVEAGHYDGTIFHRVINGFMIQGGGMDKNGKERPTNPPIENEAGNGLRNDSYTVAMARTSAPHSATSQFFINVKNNDFLNKDQAQDGWGYAVFGKVVKGHNVVNKIKAAPNRENVIGESTDAPLTPVEIIRAAVVDSAD